MLEFHFGTILFQLIVVIILIFVVAKLGMRPMLDIMRKRQDHIENEISTAESNRKEAALLLEQQKTELNNVRHEAQEIIERAKKQSEGEAQEMINLAKERADRLLEDARSEISLERDKAVATLRDEVAHLSVLLATKVLEKEVDAKSHEKEINQFLQQAGDRL